MLLESLFHFIWIGDLFDFQTFLFLNCYFALSECSNHQCPSGSHRLNKNASTHIEIFGVSLSICKHLMNSVSWNRVLNYALSAAPEGSKWTWTQMDFCIVGDIKSGPKACQKNGSSEMMGFCLILQATAPLPSFLKFVFNFIFVFLNVCVYIFVCPWTCLQ